ncbi:thioesterase domain-containing protein [Algibacter mikhailovii]|uniref:thioesterase domain-containing protein n=1 Tax=Algibacter mikhailovii TaxID=425498 RepID=UPI0024941523|nr:phosphopantetheine-binding protein [Algibacter mikhailovii]
MNEDLIIKRIGPLTAKDKKLLSLKLRDMVHSGALKIRNQNQKQLNAYVCADQITNTEDLKSYIKGKMPDYMVPSNIYKINEFPLLPNGKVDKSRLRNTSIIPTNSKGDIPEEINQPKNDIEKKLIHIYEEVLGFSPIKVDDNFFEIGGDSILSIQIIARAKKEGIDLKANQVFENQTIADLSAALSKSNKSEIDYHHLTIIRKGGTKPPLFCIHSGGGHVFFYGLLKDYIKEDRPIYALQPSGLDDNSEDMHQNVEEMSKDYLKTIREIQPHGPYNVLVYCFSTSVGNEMSLLLEGTGEKINIIVVDTMASAWNAADNDAILARTKFFFKRLVTSPFRTIKLFFEERYYLIEPYVIKFFGKTHEKKLEVLKANLRRISIEYKWKKHPGSVSLILTDKKDKGFNEYIVQSWKRLAQGGVHVFYTKGNHNTLFEKPDVQFVAEKIDLSMERQPSSKS